MTDTKQPESLATQLAQAFDPDPFIESDRDKSQRLAEQLDKQAKEYAFIRNCSLECEAAKHLLTQEARIAELEGFEFAYKEWIDKTDWVQRTAKPKELGKHRADILRQRIVELEAQLEAIGAGGVTGLRNSDTALIDFLANKDQGIANVVLPRHIIERNVHSMRDAIKDAKAEWEVIAQEGGK